jgi:hypothetical protein
MSNNALKLVPATALALLIGAAAANAAGFGGLGGLGGLGGGNQGGQSNVMSPDALESNYTALNVKFAGSMREMLTAQAYTIAALGDKTKADQLTTEANSLTGVNDINVVSRTIADSQDASTEINNKMAGAGALDAQSKATLAMAVPHYAEGILRGLELPKAYQDWASNAQGTADSMKGNPMNGMAVGKLLREIKDVAGVTTHLPALLSTWSTTTGNFIKFSKSNHVDTGDLASKI